MNTTAHTISAVIPTRNEAPRLASLLNQLSEIDVAQIIVSDGDSSDETRAVAKTFPHVTVITGETGRGNQIARATPLLTGEIIWLLHADSRLCHDPLPEMRGLMADKSVALGCFSLCFDARGFWYDLYERFSRFDSVWSTFGDQGFFMRRSDYVRLGGCPQIPLFEDVALRRAAKSLGAIKKLKTPIITSAHRFRRYGPLKTQLMNARLLLNYLNGADPVGLAQRYYGQSSELAGHCPGPIPACNPPHHPLFPRA